MSTLDHEGFGLAQVYPYARMIEPQENMTPVYVAAFVQPAIGEQKPIKFMARLDRLPTETRAILLLDIAEKNHRWWKVAGAETAMYLESISIYDEAAFEQMVMKSSGQTAQ